MMRTPHGENLRRRKIAVLLILFALIVQPMLARQDGISTALKTITAAEVYEHVLFLASDTLQGRETLEPGIAKARKHIAGAFQEYGLVPIGDDSSYLQSFVLQRLSLGENNILEIVEETGGKESFSLKSDFVPYNFTANTKVEGPAVFAGYGISAPECRYDDYRNLSVRGKIVLAITHEPREKDAESVFDGSRLSEHSKPYLKAINAREHGAVALLLVTDPRNHRSLLPRGYPWPSLYPTIPDDILPLTLEEIKGAKIPVAQVSGRFARRLLSGSGEKLESLQSSIDSTLTPRSFVVAGKKVIFQTSLEVPLQAEEYNVVGLVPGSDPRLNDEVVIIGAHYDHVGLNEESGEVFNGADDNASGTAGLLAVARAFSQVRPKRSILFIAFSAEELGLLGSRHYANDPLWPLNKTVAMLNMDMIGRSDSNRVEVYGWETSSKLKDINKAAGDAVGLVLLYKKGMLMHSDQAPFIGKKIPALFFNTGHHPDYHKPTDTADKIVAESLAMIARMVFLTAWEVSNRPQPPAFELP